MYHTKRKGLSLVESLILVIVLLVAIGAIFTTMWSSQRNYVHHKQAREAREVMFRWFQAFEAHWPPDDNFAQTRLQWLALATQRIEDTSDLLGGPTAWVGSHPAGGANNLRTRLGNYLVDARPDGINHGRLDVTIVIREGTGREILNQVRSYNIYSVDAVADVLREVDV